MTYFFTLAPFSQQFFSPQTAVLDEWTTVLVTDCYFECIRGTINNFLTDFEFLSGSKHLI
jgi:hypothetical protein